MSYGGDPLNDPLDAIRRAIGDIGDDPEFTDEEISYYYTTYGDIFLAASNAASDLAAYYARRVNKSIGSRSISNDQLFRHYTELADRLRAQATARKAGSISMPPIRQITDSVSSNFPASQRLSDIDVEPFGDDTA
ncbi:MAG: hypothetical protein A4E48_00225 [Methanosaeta sp. PtaU1.Bin060]|nr:MAG: hypothetical protein A4E48_00225 [Methanosaeta sp. PtaU1.Bin060]